MPVRPREMVDVPSESRIREVVRAILNQEVRRLLLANSTLDTQVATNTSNIAANASGIASNDNDIDEIMRRAYGNGPFGYQTSRDKSEEFIRRFML